MSYEINNAETTYIVRNSATCKKCKDQIQSTHVHDFVSCKCGGIFVDGGCDYLRRGGKFLEDIEDTSVTMTLAELLKAERLRQILAFDLSLQATSSSAPRASKGRPKAGRKPSTSRCAKRPVSR